MLVKPSPSKRVQQTKGGKSKEIWSRHEEFNCSIPVPEGLGASLQDAGVVIVGGELLT